ncbi:acetolactate synthase small subunit [Actinomycetota bacterium]|nr:acetolactate synthase small subunit [Actinomycetota bacterium]
MSTQNNFKRYTLSVLVEDKPSTLTRIAGLFARRAFNIHSLAVGPTQTPGVSRVTIVTDESSNPIEQIVNQLRKLIYVLKVDVMDVESMLSREVILIKISVESEGSARTAALEVVDLFRAKVIDVTPVSLTIQATGAPDKLKGLVDALEPYNIIEMVKSGTIALTRGPQTIEMTHHLGDVID